MTRDETVECMNGFKRVMPTEFALKMQVWKELDSDIVSAARNEPELLTPMDHVCLAALEHECVPSDEELKRLALTGAPKREELH